MSASHWAIGIIITIFYLIKISIHLVYAYSFIKVGFFVSIEVKLQ